MSTEVAPAPLTMKARMRALCRDQTSVRIVRYAFGVTLSAALAKFLGVDIDQLPLAGAAPEWYSEKAVAIGAYVVASGIYTVLGVQPAIFGSPNVVKLLAEGLDDVVGAKFAVEPDPEKAAVLIRRHIEAKREGLGLPFLAPEKLDAEAA